MTVDALPLKFDFPAIEHEHPLSDAEKRALRIPEQLPIADWAEKNLELVTGAYVLPGPFRAYHWQRAPLNAPLTWRKTIYMLPTQMGKSTMADAVGFYYMDQGISGIICYDRMETVKGVFKKRLRPMIEKNQSLRDLWDGNDDNLTIDNIIMRACMWGVGSAQNPRTLSTFPAGIYIGSEVSKWEKKDYNPVDMLRGRGGAYWKIGVQRGLLESTPFSVDDYLYQEIYNSGTAILTPHWPCPHCNAWQTFSDRQIKLREGHPKDVTPEWIRGNKEKACAYRCIECDKEIEQKHRYVIDGLIEWSMPELDQPRFKQIGRPVGSFEIEELAQSYDAVCFNANRMLDNAFPFWECLALFWESKRNPAKLRTYHNETMAQYYDLKAERVNISRVDIHKADYTQGQADSSVPDECVVLTCGIDTQDDGFYYCVVGWGNYMHFDIIQQGYVRAPLIDTDSINKQQLYDALISREIMRTGYRYADDTELEIKYGLIDRGGHRASDVDFLVRSITWLQAYIGIRTVNPKKPLITRSQDPELSHVYLGQAQSISEITGKLINLDDWRMPANISADFTRQLTAQYFVTKELANGNLTKIWVTGREDHYRDCFNLAYGAAVILRLPEVLTVDGNADILRDRIRKGAPRREAAEGVRDRHADMKKDSNYFNRAIGRRGR